MRGRALVIAGASGFAGLGLQIVWTQQGALALGHEAASMLAVITAFFGGIALGAFAFGPRVAGSARPARAYAICEALIGAWALLLAFAFTPLSAWWVSWLPLSPTPLAQWSWVFAGTFLWLLPATAAMGATLPAMERVLAAPGERDSPIAPLYAANTLGAVLGALGAAFVLIPIAGLRTTALVCATVNVACAVAATRAFAGHAPSPDPAPPAQPRAWPTLLTLAITGLLGIGYEVLVVRALSQVAENTVYTFAILLATYLVGTAGGAATYTRWRGTDDGRTRDTLLAALALACLIGAAVLAGAPTFKTWMAPRGIAAALGVEAALAIGAFLPATICMGALFSHLASTATRAGVPFARCLAVNTLGAAAAPLVAAALVIGGAGLREVLVGTAAVYLLLVSARAWTRPAQHVAAVAVVAAAFWMPSPARVDVPEGGRVARQIEGPLATVTIVEDAAGTATLHIDNKQQEGSSATVYADARQGVLPLLLQPGATRALFLGLGTGVTARAASGIVDVDAVELLPEVIAAAGHFDAVLPAARPPHLIAADARRFVRDARVRYDVIVADNFHPARSGSGTLYTVEHFRAVRERLSEHGLFCQWLPLHQLDLATLRSIVRSYLVAYPSASAVLATHSLETPVIGLIARRDGAPLDAPAIAASLAETSSHAFAARFGFDDELAVLGSFIAGPESLRHFAAEARVNTDDRPVVAYSAPAITYQPTTTPRERLFTLLQAVSAKPDEIVGASAEAAFSRRLEAYWRARHRFVLAGRDVRPTSDVRAMLGQVRGPLLDVLRLSPDFRPAYDPLLGMAQALAQSDPGAGRELLEQLVDVSPSRPEAARILASPVGTGR